MFCALFNRGLRFFRTCPVSLNSFTLTVKGYLHMKSLNQLRDEAHENARAHGFHDTDVSMGDSIALMHTELSEAFEEYRKGAPISRVCYERKYRSTLDGSEQTEEVAYADAPVGSKPVGIPSEMADVIIRILDFCGKHKIDIERAVTEKMAYNATRPFRHGGKIV